MTPRAENGSWRFVDGVYTSWIHLSDEVEKGAIRYARAHNARYMFCGHTHKARRVTRDGVIYVNTGSWTGESETGDLCDDL